MSTPNFASAVSFEDDMMPMLLRDTSYAKCWKNVSLRITDYNRISITSNNLIKPWKIYIISEK